MHRKKVKFFSQFFFFHKWLTSLDLNLLCRMFTVLIEVFFTPEERVNGILKINRPSLYRFNYNHPLILVLFFAAKKKSETLSKAFFSSPKKNLRYLSANIAIWLCGCKFFERLNELICAPQKNTLVSIQLASSFLLCSFSHLSASLHLKYFKTLADICDLSCCRLSG